MVLRTLSRKLYMKLCPTDLFWKQFQFKQLEIFVYLEQPPVCFFFELNRSLSRFHCFLAWMKRQYLQCNCSFSTVQLQHFNGAIVNFQIATTDKLHLWIITWKNSSYRHNILTLCTILPHHFYQTQVQFPLAN